MGARLTTIERDARAAEAAHRHALKLSVVAGDAGKQDAEVRRLAERAAKARKEANAERELRRLERDLKIVPDAKPGDRATAPKTSTSTSKATPSAKKSSAGRRQARSTRRRTSSVARKVTRAASSSAPFNGAALGWSIVGMTAFAVAVYLVLTHSAALTLMERVPGWISHIVNPWTPTPN